MKFSGIVEVVAAGVPPEVVGRTKVDVVPTEIAVGPAEVVLPVPYVDVTDATTWEMVIVLVIVAVDVRVVVEDVVS